MKGVHIASEAEMDLYCIRKLEVNFLKKMAQNNKVRQQDSRELKAIIISYLSQHIALLSLLHEMLGFRNS